MANSFVHYTCWFIVLTTFVDQGDGRWKKKDKENLQHDIELFRQMADKIEFEIGDYYDDYSTGRKEEQIVNSLKPKFKENVQSRVNVTWEHEQRFFDPSANKVYGNSKKKLNKTPKVVPQTNFVELTDYNYSYNTKIDKARTPTWPKFEDILLQMGKRYDWKNDRWLKVKVKLKDTSAKKISDNNIEFHEKHKFYYKIVKLNRSKNRRSVVVAVSAVR